MLFFVLNRRWRVNYGVKYVTEMKQSSPENGDSISSKRRSNGAHRVRPRRRRNIIHSAELLLLGTFGRTN